MSQIRQTERASKVLNKAYEYCKDYRHEFIMPEHLLMVLIDEFNFNAALNISVANPPQGVLGRR